MPPTYSRSLTSQEVAQMNPSGQCFLPDGFICATNEPIWTVFPASFYAPPPARTDLDAYLQGKTLTRVSLPMYYTYEGRPVRLKYGLWKQGYLDSGVERRKIRTWWGYPCQVLLLPAIVIDVVTSPIQIYLGLKEFDSHF